MKSIRNLLAPLFILGGFVALCSLLHAQQTATPTQSGKVLTTATTDVSALSDLEVEVKAIEMTTPLPASAAPVAGNFYSTQHLPGTANEWPPLPENIKGTPIWPLGGDFYLLDDATVSYNPPATKKLTASGTQMMASLSPDDGGDTNGVVGEALSSYTPLNLAASTNLWLAITNLANGTAYLMLSNTIADVQYEIVAAPTLAGLMQTGWVSLGSVFGSELTNWTPASVVATNQPTLFLRARSDIDSTGSGLPDWWQLKYFGYVGVDPYADPDGDGWNNLQEFEYGMNPKSFDTPPAPQGLAVASYNAGTSTASLNWLASPGPVSSYQIQTPNGTYPVSSGTAYADTASSLGSSYRVRAIYQGGPSAWSASVSVPSGFSIGLITGPQNLAYLVVPSLPAGAGTIRITRNDLNAESLGNYSLDTNFDFPATSITNGFFQIPAACVEGPVNSYGVAYHAWSAQILDTNKYALSQAVDLGIGSKSSGQGEPDWLVQPYFDGRVQLKQNLIFQFRDASRYVPFDIVTYTEDIYGNPSSQTYSFNPEDYVYSSFYDVNNYNGLYGSAGDYAALNAFRPFQDNYLYRNFVYTTTNVDADGFLTTGVQIPSPADDIGTNVALQLPPTYLSLTNASAPVLATNQTRWLGMYPLTLEEADDDNNSSLDYAQYLSQIGITSQDSPVAALSLASNVSNYWGLPFLSAEIYYYNPQGNYQNSVLAAGNSINYYGTGGGGPVYMETAQPKFQTVEYDFWNGSPSPGTTSFSTSQTSDLLVTPVGNPNFQVAGYAKLAVQNGYSGVYGYLGQYFDQAYQITNGVVTTNTTGVLSPYGQFFATQPGPAALVTMPDLDTGARGTATVYCVSLQLDANHDGTMDTSFNGPDATSQASPMEFWANNNHDRWFNSYYGTGFELEQDDLNPAQISTLHWEQQVPDCQYTTNLMPAIPCTRDLEDYFRLWTPGVAALMKVVPSNYTVQLTLTGTGQIRIFQAIESSGGTNYLFDETTASNQVANSTSLYAGLLSSNSPIIFINQTNFNEHFIFCGAQTGSAQIDLQVLDGSLNVVADVPVFLQINDIKNMYERWTVGDDSAVAPLAAPVLAGNDMPAPPQAAFQYALSSDTNTPYILHVHGYNMAVQDKDHFAETEFKRLYWQGYRGRFGEFRWPTTIQGFFNLFSAFNLSESNAWASAKGLTNLLTKLNAEYPGNVYLTAHSHGNIMAGEALKLAGANQMVNTYIAMQSALASHAYDSSTPYEYSLPYPDYYAQYPASGGTNYFNGMKGAGTYVNFFNTNDWALTGPWPLDQAGKPVSGYTYGTVNGITGFYSGSGAPYTLLTVPPDRYTIFSYCDPATCYALGAQSYVGGAFKSGTNYNQVELDVAPYNFGKLHIYHSGEFRSDNAQRWLFWDEVLFQMGLKKSL